MGEAIALRIEGGALRRRRSGRRPADRGPRRRPRHRHLPRRQAVPRARSGGAAAGSASRPRPRSARSCASSACRGPAQDRHAAAARRPHDRLGADARRSRATRERWTHVARAARAPTCPQLACAITRTNERTHDVIRAGLDRSPLVRRRDRGAGAALLPVDRGQGRTASATATATRSSSSPRASTMRLVYPNGISTSLPTDDQLRLVRSDRGPRARRDRPAGLCGRI